MTQLTDDQHYGYYSAKQAEMIGSSIYLDTNGKLVEVTSVTKSPPDEYLKEGWEDTTFVCIVTKWQKRGQTGGNRLTKELDNG